MFFEWGRHFPFARPILVAVIASGAPLLAIIFLASSKVPTTTATRNLPPLLQLLSARRPPPAASTRTDNAYMVEHPVSPPLVAASKDGASAPSQIVDTQPLLPQPLAAVEVVGPNQMLEENLTCPITAERLRDPVILVGDGHTYERKAIEQWLEKNNTSPMMNTKLRTKELVPNYAMRRMLDDVARKTPLPPQLPNRVEAIVSLLL